MAEHTPALRQLERILYVLPMAERDGGAEIEALCSALDVSPRTLLADIDQVGSRLYYFPAAWAEDISIDVDPERIHVRSGGRFSRPRRLSPREALALAIGLRRLAFEETEVDGERMLQLAAWLDARLAVISAIDVAPRWSAAESDGRGDGIRAVLRVAVRQRKVCELTYMTAGRGEVSARSFRPYLLVERGGKWYAIGHCSERDDVRSFRLDRMLDLVVTNEVFEVPARFNPDDHLHGGRVYTPDDPVEVTVRYSPRVAGWLRERGPVEEQEDGSVVVAYSVSDPTWIVRLVLQYGPEAELLGPRPIRELLVEALARVVTDDAPGAPTA
jgi:proteasome accessory factor C